MAYSSDSNTEPTARKQGHDASSQECMELVFFNLFSDNFMRSIGEPARMILEQKHPGMLTDIMDNLHKLSDYAAGMIQRQGLSFKDLAQQEQDIFVGEFLRQIDVFADKVRESFEEITPEQEKKLLDAYAKSRPSGP